MDIDIDAFASYYRNRDLPKRARQARLAAIVSAWRKRGLLSASLVDLACRVRILALEPACALSPAA